MNKFTYDRKNLEDDFQTRLGNWVECGKCRSIMYDTFIKCWSCGLSMTGKNMVPVKL